MFLRSDNIKYPSGGDGAVGHEVRLLSATSPSLLQVAINNEMAVIKNIPTAFRLLGIELAVQPSRLTAVLVLERVIR